MMGGGGGGGRELCDVSVKVKCDCPKTFAQSLLSRNAQWEKHCVTAQIIAGYETSDFSAIILLPVT